MPKVFWIACWTLLISTPSMAQWPPVHPVVTALRNQPASMWDFGELLLRFEMKDLADTLSRTYGVSLYAEVMVDGSHILIRIGEIPPADGELPGRHVGQHADRDEAIEKGCMLMNDVRQRLGADAEARALVKGNWSGLFRLYCTSGFYDRAPDEIDANWPAYLDSITSIAIVTYYGKRATFGSAYLEGGLVTGDCNLKVQQ